MTDVIQSLIDSLESIQKKDPTALTDLDLNRMHTAKMLLKK